MNYLSHFIIDHSPHEHYYNVALILPDISKSWIKTFKSPPPSPTFSLYQKQLLNGSLKHYESDTLFHSSAFFERYQFIINEFLKTVTFSSDVNRKWFIAHILTELLIDRQFVKNNVYYVDQFYKSLHSIENSELSSFLNFYGMPDTTDFFKFFDHFRNVKYIYYYADNNKFIYSLNRIMMRVGIKELNEKDANLLLDAVLHIETTYMNDSNKLMSELKAVFR